MEFFNRKEEVVDVQLTQYGKALLSQGKFRPVFYGFYDADILYDTTYGGFGEPQSDAQDRTFETVRIKALSAFEGAETRIAKMTNIKNLGGDNPELFKYIDQSVLEDEALSFSDYQPTQTKYYALGSSLGTSRLTSIYAPSWNISLIDGLINEPGKGIKHYTTASISNEMIPQIDIELKTRISVFDPSLQPNISPTELTALQQSDVYADGTSININIDPLLIDIQENNSDTRRPSFDVEVFEIKKDENNSEMLIPLRFENITKREDGYVVGKDVVSNANEDNRYSEYFLDLSLDGQVQRQAQVPLPSKTSTPDFSVPFTPLSEIPINDFLCPDEITTEEQLEQAYNTDGGGLNITVQNSDNNTDFNNMGGAGPAGGDNY